jgi:hypothetical protein
MHFDTGAGWFFAYSESYRPGYLGAWVRIVAGAEMFIFTPPIPAVGPSILLLIGYLGLFPL